MVVALRRLLYVLAASSLGFAVALPKPLMSTRDEDYAPENIITRDFCVIGGGASGTYAAIGLKDRGKSVVVIEKESQLGGHTNTYTDPVTGYTYDYGVQVFDNVPVVQQFYARFNIPLVLMIVNENTAVNQFVDFTTGKLNNFIPPNPILAFEAYGAQLAKYPYTAPGYNLPNPVPADLLLPFGDFANKYGIGDAVFAISSITQGVGNPLTVPTLYQMKLFSSTVLQSSFGGFLLTANHDNSEIYIQALAELGSNVLLQSQVVSMDRDPRAPYPISIAVSTPTGPKLIQAQKLVVAIPQELQNLQGFDLDNSERGVFGQFTNAYYWTALINNTGIPAGYTLYNANPNLPYDLFPQPGGYVIRATPIAGLFIALWGSQIYLSDGVVKLAIIDAVLKFRNDGLNTTVPNFVEFKNHSPFMLQVSANQIRNGFYAQLNGLQGYRNTWYTGAALATEDSSAVWNFTQSLFPSMLA